MNEIQWQQSSRSHQVNVHEWVFFFLKTKVFGTQFLQLKHAWLIFWAFSGEYFELNDNVYALSKKYSMKILMNEWETKEKEKPEILSWRKIKMRRWNRMLNRKLRLLAIYLSNAADGISKKSRQYRRRVTRKFMENLNKTFFIFRLVNITYMKCI